MVRFVTKLIARIVLSRYLTRADRTGELQVMLAADRKGRGNNLTRWEEFSSPEAESVITDRACPSTIYHS